jgi:hypothetical protein
MVKKFNGFFEPVQTVAENRFKKSKFKIQGFPMTDEL